MLNEEELNNRSVAYHAHPSNASSCAEFVLFYRRRCPCESYIVEENEASSVSECLTARGDETEELKR